MTSPSWKDVQHDTALAYCNSVLVLDDEIEKQPKTGDGGRLLNNRFHKVREAFRKTGAICDLRQVDASSELHWIEAIGPQLKKADVLIIDWHLAADDPKQAVEVIQAINELQGFRFIGIYTNRPEADVLRGLKLSFGDQLKSVTSTQGVLEESGISLGEGDSPSAIKPAEAQLFEIGGHVYVTVVAKSADDSESTLPEVFASCLKRVYPDHLHWAALELAIRARECLPTLLSCLPKNTDPAIAFQTLVQGENELGQTVTERLVLELSEALRTAPLDAVQDSTVLGNLIERMAQKPTADERWATLNSAALKAACVQKNQRHRLKDGTEVNRFKFAAEFYPLFFDKDTLVAEDHGGLADHKSKMTQVISHALDQEVSGSPVPHSHSTYAAFCEHLQLELPARLGPGVVLRKNETKGGASWLVCISPACDCARGSGKRDYLFVGGKTDNSLMKGGRDKSHTCIRFDDRVEHVIWTSRDIAIHNWSPTAPEGYSFFTRLHDGVLQTIIQTVWGWQTRAGINTSDYVRVARP
jgi:hypothetical protein